MSRHLLPFAVLLLAAACEKPTAPEMRDMTARIEKKLGRGDLQGVWNALGSAGAAGYLTADGRVLKNSAALIVRDGLESELHGFVVENVFVPPRGMGRPIHRRTFVAWPDDRSFAVIAMSEAHPGTVGRDLWFGQQGRSVIPPAFLQVADYRPSQSWLSRAGAVTIDEPLDTRSCDEPIAEYPGPPQVLRCEWMLYHVRIEGEFIAASDTSALVTDGTRHRLHVPDQRVPGLRFTTTCPERNDSLQNRYFLQDCWAHLERYWADNALFARDLNVDVAALAARGLVFSRDLVAGDGEFTGGPSVIRWRISAPNGRLLEQDSTGTVKPNPRRDVEVLMSLLGQPTWKTRRQALVPARYLFPNRSSYEMVVMELEWGPAQ